MLHFLRGPVSKLCQHESGRREFLIAEQEPIFLKRTNSSRRDRKRLVVVQRMKTELLPAFKIAVGLERVATKQRLQEVQLWRCQ